MSQIPPFAAPTWLKSGHAQTIYAATLWNPPPLRADRQVILSVEAPTQAETRLLCEWNRADREQSASCLILVHGLESCSQARYMTSTARKALARGLDVLRMNMRSCGPQTHHKRLSPTLYHAGLSADLLAVCRHAVDELGYSAVVIGGFSLGAHMVLKLATEVGSEYPWLRGACAISAPLDLSETARSIVRPSNFVYERYYYRRMRQTYLQRRRWWPQTRLEALAKAHNLYEFDRWITGPEFGYRDAEDYYRQNSANQWLDRIEIPTCIIHAMDDPVVPFGAYERALEENDPPKDKIEWLLTTEGGHVGFINDGALARQDQDALWAENRLLDFAQRVVQGGIAPQAEQAQPMAESVR